jgi:hypothetical protein
LFGSRLAGAQAVIFFAKPYCEKHQLSFGLRLDSEELHHSAIRTKKELDFGRFFHQVSMRQPIGR